MKKYDWVIREANGSDIPFIYSTWAHSYRYGSAIGKSCRNSVFFHEYHQVIDWILSRPLTTISMAVLPDEQDVVLGYIVSEDSKIIHYLFVKEAFRKMGIGKSLLAELTTPESYTHKTYCVLDILHKNPDQFIYNPFILFHKGEEKHGGSEG